MNTPRTRIPRPHIYAITVPNPRDEGAPLLEVMVEAPGIREARAWFTQNILDIREATPRQVYGAGLKNLPFFTAEDFALDEEPRTEPTPTGEAPNNEDPELWSLSDPELSEAFGELEK